MPLRRLLPTIVDDQMASQRQRELRLPRHVATDLGRSAVDAIDAGLYEGPDGVMVDWRWAVRGAVAAKRSVPPREACSRRLTAAAYPLPRCRSRTKRHLEPSVTSGTLAHLRWR